MKRSLKQTTLIVFALISASVFFSCDKTEYDNEIAPDVLTLAKPEGGTVFAMNGNVILEFTASAITSPVYIFVSECEKGDCTDYLLNPIEISPKMTFEKPVMLKLKYDCDLSTGMSMDGASPYGCCWNNESLFSNESMPQVLACEVDKANKTINLYITQTGVIAIKCAKVGQ